MGARFRAAGWVALAILVSSCTGTETGSTPATSGTTEHGEETAPEPGPAVDETVGLVNALQIVQTAPGVVELSWEPKPTADRYRVSAGAVFDVPAVLCDQLCRLAFGTESAETAAAVEISVVTSDDRIGPSSSVELGTVTGRVDPTRPTNDQGFWVFRSDGASPEFVAVDNHDQAREQALQAMVDDPMVMAVADSWYPSRPATSDDAIDEREELPRGIGLTTWQQQALAIDRMPNRGRGVVVAVIDDGVDPNHPAFQGATILPGAQFYDGVEPSGTGIEDPGTHGTSVASMIVAQPDSPIPGIAPEATILPIDLATTADGALTFTPEEWDAAVRWAVDQGADVIVNAQGTTCTRPVLPGQVGIAVEFNCPLYQEQAAAYAEENGVVFIAAAGNNGTGCGRGFDNARQWPAAISTVISVGYHTRDGSRSQCSPDRDDVDLLAPGFGLLVAYDGFYGVTSGSSQSAPLVAGFLAIILVERPGMTPLELRVALDAGLVDNLRLNTELALASVDVDIRPFDWVLGAGVYGFTEHVWPVTWPEHPASGDRPEIWAACHEETFVYRVPGNPFDWEADFSQCKHLQRLLGIAGTVVEDLEQDTVTGRARLVVHTPGFIYGSDGRYDHQGFLAICPAKLDTVRDLPIEHPISILDWDFNLEFEVTGSRIPDDTLPDGIRRYSITIEPIRPNQAGPDDPLGLEGKLVVHRDSLYNCQFPGATGSAYDAVAITIDYVQSAFDQTIDNLDVLVTNDGHLGFASRFEAAVRECDAYDTESTVEPVC